MDGHLISRLLARRRLGLVFSCLVGLYGFIMSILIATSIGLNSYTPEELDTVERLQYILQSVVAVGALVGAVAALMAVFHPPLAMALFIAAGVIAAVGLGLVATSWAVVSGPRVEYYLAPVTVVHWATAALLARSILEKAPTMHQPTVHEEVTR